MPRHLLTEANILTGPIEDGDAGVVLKPDGSFRIFTAGDIDPANLTETHQNQGILLQALAVALTVPEALTFLTNLANDRTLFHEEPLHIAATH